MEHIIHVTLSNKNFYNVYTFDSYSFILGTQLSIHNCMHMDRGAWTESLLPWNAENEMKAHHCKQNWETGNDKWNHVFKRIIKI